MTIFSGKWSVNPISERLHCDFQQVSARWFKGTCKVSPILADREEVCSHWAAGILFHMDIYEKLQQRNRGDSPPIFMFSSYTFLLPSLWPDILLYRLTWYTWFGIGTCVTERLPSFPTDGVQWWRNVGTVSFLDSTATESCPSFHAVFSLHRNVSNSFYKLFNYLFKINLTICLSFLRAVVN